MIAAICRRRLRCGRVVVMNVVSGRRRDRLAAGANGGVFIV